MSKYTTEVRYICENYAGLLESTGYNKVDEVIENARGKVFDFHYPIFDEAYKSVLETKILKHFYTREIGAETVGLWKLWLNTRLNEIMPYYNQLYKSELLEFNPLYDVDVTREHKGKRTGTKEDTGETTGNSTENRESAGTGTGNNTGKVNTKDNRNTNGGSNTAVNSTESESSTKWDYYSDTPQGSVSNLDTLEYLTNARKLTNSGNKNGSSNTENEYSETGENIGETTSVNDSTNSYTNNESSNGSTSGTSKLSSVINNTDDYLETVKGKQGSVSYSKMLEEYRNTFLNIDVQVINELNDLFMNLW